MGTDALIADIESRINKETSFQDKLVSDAQSAGRDLSDSDAELYDRSLEQLRKLQPQLDRVLESRRISDDSSKKFADVHSRLEERPPARPVEYRSAGAYVLDMWASRAGDSAAAGRLDTYLRAAAHQTTADNLGVIPEPVVGNVINFIDGSRPIVSALGARSIPGGRFDRPKVTQHTDTAVQASEKTELVSRKMLISKVQVLMATYGGYVNVSRQDIDWSSPQIMDIVIQDLAVQYALDTEAATAAALNTNSTAGATIPTGTPTADAVAGAIWAAAALAWTAVPTGNLFIAVPPGMLSMVGPLFPPYGGTNQQGQGFSAGGFGTGSVGAISGIPVVMSTALTANTMLVVNTAAAEVYEQRVGSLQVIEPSVLGVQVAYAGYFAPVVIESGGVIKITKTP